MLTAQRPKPTRKGAMVRVEEKEEDADDEEVRGWTVTEAEHTARDSEAEPEFEEEVRGWMSRGRAHGT